MFDLLLTMDVEGKNSYYNDRCNCDGRYVSMLVLLVMTRIISGRKNKNKYLQELRYDDVFVSTGFAV